MLRFRCEKCLGSGFVAKVINMAVTVEVTIVPDDGNGPGLSYDYGSGMEIHAAETLRFECINDSCRHIVPGVSDDEDMLAYIQTQYEKHCLQERRKLLDKVWQYIGTSTERYPAMVDRMLAMLTDEQLVAFALHGRPKPEEDG